MLLMSCGLWGFLSHSLHQLPGFLDVGLPPFSQQHRGATHRESTPFATLGRLGRLGRRLFVDVSHVKDRHGAHVLILVLAEMLDPRFRTVPAPVNANPVRRCRVPSFGWVPSPPPA